VTWPDPSGQVRGEAGPGLPRPHHRAAPFLTNTTFLLDYGTVSYADVAVATRLLSRSGLQEYLDAEPACPWDERVPPPGRDATLLAVVPIPGTGTSLAIVGYAIATSGAPNGSDAAPDRSTHDPATAIQEPVAGTADSGLLLDHVQRRVWADGRELALTFQEFELLSFLTAHPARVFSRADLVRQVWQGGRADDGRADDGRADDGRAAPRDSRSVRRDSRTVDVHISRLRHKLGPMYSQCLVTEHRAGYQFRPLT
jgi:DNA-binding winged helix-turn-helix (wHTH) protein